jgi:hypothetical protein
MNTRIYNQIGNSLEGLNQADTDRFVKYDDLSSELKDVATKTNRHLKIAMAEMSSLYNKLNSLNLGPSVCIRLKAKEKSRKRGCTSKDELRNKSHLARSKSDFASDDIGTGTDDDVPIMFTAPLMKNPAKRSTPSCSVCNKAGVPADQ